MSQNSRNLNCTKQFATHPNPREIYEAKLIQQGTIDQAHAHAVSTDLNTRLETYFEAAKKQEKVNVTNFLGDLWKDFSRGKEEDFEYSPVTGVPEKRLLELGKKLATTSGR